MPHVSWRSRARPIIARVLAETRGQDEKSIRGALFDAYPFHERRMYPHSVWLDEIRRQRGLKPAKRVTQAAAAGQARLLDLGGPEAGSDVAEVGPEAPVQQP